MRIPDSDFQGPSQRAGRIGPIDSAPRHDAEPGPSYVQSVLFGRRRRGTHPLAVSTPAAASTARVNALMGADRTADMARVAPEPERT